MNGRILCLVYAGTQYHLDQMLLSSPPVCLSCRFVHLMALWFDQGWRMASSHLVSHINTQGQMTGVCAWISSTLALVTWTECRSVLKTIQSHSPLWRTQASVSICSLPFRLYVRVTREVQRQIQCPGSAPRDSSLMSPLLKVWSVDPQW